MPEYSKRRLAVVFGLEEWEALPWPLKLFLSGVGTATLGLGVLLVVFAVVAAAWRAEHRIHAFQELSLELAPGAQVTLYAFGNWRPAEDDPAVEVNGSPYVIDIRVRGLPAEGLAIRSLRFVDASTGDEYIPDELSPYVISQTEIMFTDRGGTPLPTSSVNVEGLLVSASGGDTVTDALSGQLKYEYRIEKPSVVWQAIMGI